MRWASCTWICRQQRKKSGVWRKPAGRPQNKGARKMYSFNYHRPLSLKEAAQFLSAASDGKLMSGGMTLIPTLKQRLANPSDVIDLGGIAGLSGIEAKGGAIVIGATTTHAEVAASAVVRSKIPALPA